MRTEILLHRIKYWYNDGLVREMTEVDEDHIKRMIEEGFGCGELVSLIDDKTYRGWWEIER